MLSQDCEEGYTYFPPSDIPFSATSLPFDSGQPFTCFNDGDIAFLNDLNGMNNLGYESALELGTQTWNTGRLKVFVATYTPNGAGINTTQIQNLPESISNLNGLKNLYISNNRIEYLNSDFGNLTELKILDAGYNYISEIPDSFINLENLEYLWLFNNDISYIPNICELDIQWSDMDNSYYPYFAIGGNELCFPNNVPECILNSDHFDESLDQFYYSFMYVIEQDCADINDAASIDILSLIHISEPTRPY